MVDVCLIHVEAELTQLTLHTHTTPETFAHHRTHPTLRAGHTQVRPPLLVTHQTRLLCPRHRGNSPHGNDAPKLLPTQGAPQRDIVARACRLLMLCPYPHALDMDALPTAKPAVGDLSLRPQKVVLTYGADVIRPDLSLRDLDVGRGGGGGGRGVGGGGALSDEVTSEELVDFALYEAQLPDHGVLTRHSEILQQHPVIVTPYIRSGEYLMQRLSVAVQRGNATSVLGSVGT